MTNISNEVSTHNIDFVVGDTVVINTPLEFINRTFDSDDLYVVQDICGLLSGGVTILIDGQRVVVANFELRHANVAEFISQRRLPAPVALFVSGLKEPGDDL